MIRTAIPAACVVGAALLAIGCTQSVAQKPETKPRINPLEISPSKEIAAVIEVGEVPTRPVSDVLRVAGRVEADETRMARVGAPVTGRVTELEAYEGEPVKRSQTLATIYSTELANAESVFLKARTQQQLGERAVARAKQLLDAGVIGEAEFQRREAELQQINTEVASSREQLGVLGLTRDALERLQTSKVVDSTTHVVSSLDGIVLERKATIGQVIQAVETMFVISDLSTVWLVADVPEQSAGGLAVGKAVEAEIPALPGQKINGRLSFVSSVVNPETRTVRARMNVENPHRRFKPAMLATMTIVDGVQARRVVPANAVVREDNADHVFVEIGPNRYLLRKVVLGDEAGDNRVLLEGLEGGERIVIKGAFHLNNERNRQLLRSSEGA
jgi:membrane fusion protein, heavy metal efflux system